MKKKCAKNEHHLEESKKNSSISYKSSSLLILKKMLFIKENILKNLIFTAHIGGVVAECCLWKQNGMDEWHNPSLRNGYALQQLVELNIIPDGQLQMTRNDPHLLVVRGSISRQFQKFSNKIFENCCHVDGCPIAYVVGKITFLQCLLELYDWHNQT